MKNVIAAGMMLALFGWWLVKPLYLHSESTSRNVSVDLIAEPFIQSDRLIYQWSGNVFRSCPVEIRRSIVDAKGVKTTFVALSFERIPSSMLGQMRYEVVVRVPEQIAEGPAVYQAFEVSKCDWLQGLFPRAVAYPPVKFTVTR